MEQTKLMDELEHQWTDPNKSTLIRGATITIDDKVIRQYFEGSDDTYRPKPRRLRESHTTKTLKRCCCAPMPFFIRFPVSVFLAVMFVLVSLVTIFVVLDWLDFPPYAIGNCPVWTWAAFLTICWIVYFVLWGILFTTRYLFIAYEYYRYTKVMYMVFGMWRPLLWLFFSVSLFGSVQLLVVWGLLGTVYVWLIRVIWMFFVFSVFALVWDLSRRLLIVVIEKDALWTRLAMLLWHEQLLADLVYLTLRNSPQRASPYLQSIIDHRSHSTNHVRLFLKTNLMASHHSAVPLDDFDLWSIDMFNVPETRLDTPSILSTESDAERKSVEVTRLAIRTAQLVMTKADTDGEQSISYDEMRRLCQSDQDADAQMSYWDTNKDDFVSMAELVEGVISIFQDREELGEVLRGHRSLGIILGTLLGVVCGLVSLIIVLQIFTIDVGAIVLPVLAVLLPLVFVFGNSLRIVWESFLVVFFIRPWFPGEEIEMVNHPRVIIDTVGLLTSTGHSPDGVFERIPNALALVQSVHNYGRTTTTRLRLLVKLATVNGKKTRGAILALGSCMKQYCDSKRRVFRKKSFSYWVEPQSGDDDINGNITIGFQVSFASIRQQDAKEFRQHRTDFLLFLREQVEELNLTPKGDPQAMRIVEFPSGIFASPPIPIEKQ